MEMNQGHELKAEKKLYHAPELTLLGPIRTAVNCAATGPTGDCGPIAGATRSTMS